MKRGATELEISAWIRHQLKPMNPPMPEAHAELIASQLAVNLPAIELYPGARRNLRPDIWLADSVLSVWACIQLVNDEWKFHCKYIPSSLNQDGSFKTENLALKQKIANHVLVANQEADTMFGLD